MGTLVWAAYSFNKQQQIVNNPYCGFYTVYRFYAHSDLLVDWHCSLDELVLKKNQSLCMLQINLLFFRKLPLTDEALQRIEEIFKWFANQKRELIVRFLYDWDGRGLQNEPSDLGIVLHHMEQLGPLLKRFSAEIYILQGLFIGSWGEMHTSRYLDAHSLTILARKLFACSGSDTFIALRCPSMWRTIFGRYEPLSEGEAYGAKMAARFGLYNDALLASETDLGTYGVVRKNLSIDYSDKFIRREELQFQNKLCLAVPNGGETIGLSPYHDFLVAKKSLAEMRVSYLNSTYDPEVLNYWRHTATNVADVYWQKKSIYAYMASHLGYRYFLKKIEVKSDWPNKNLLTVRIRIINQGLANAYRSFRVALQIRTTNFKLISDLPAITDTRFWHPGTNTDLEWSFDYSLWPEGVYVLGLQFFDCFSKKTIYLANDLPVDFQGLHSLGYLSLRVGEN